MSDNTIRGGGGAGRVGDWCGTPVPQQTRFDKIRDLIGKHKDAVNTNQQLDVINQVWDNMQPEIVAEYIAPWPGDDPSGPVLRYLAPMPPPTPDDDIVAEYIAVAPGSLPSGYDPSEYMNRTGSELVDIVNNRDHADPNDLDGNRFPDDLIMYYLVAPPPPDPEQAARFNQLRKFDVDMNKTFKALLETADRIVSDDHISPDELDAFSRLHFSFELCAKLFYDGVREYQKDFPMHRSPEEPRNNWRTFAGDDQPVTAPTSTEPADPATSPLGTLIGSRTSGDDE